MRRLLVILCLLASPLSAQDHPLHIVWAHGPVAQLRFLYSHMQTEFAGCLYGNQVGDSLTIGLFISSATDPRTASDSGVAQGACPNIVTVKGTRFVGVVHSHIRRGSMCLPSHKDLLVLETWRANGAIFGAVMCGQGDSIAIFSPHTLVVVAIPPLDSLYPR